MFIVFEGGEGSGKSTQVKLLIEWLTKKGIDNLVTKEPGSPLSKECGDIRKLLLDPANDLSEMAELFLYLADRAQHVDKIVRRAVDEGFFVVSDRFYFSTYAYQGYGRGQRFLGQDNWFWQTMREARYDLYPDITFVLDMPVEVGLARAKRSNEEFVGGDRIEKEKIEFHQKVRDGFLELAEQFKGNEKYKVVVLDATKSIEEIHEDIKQVVLTRIK